MPRDGRLEGCVAVVTGGSNGIGRAVCVALQRGGASVVIVGRTRANLAETLAQLEAFPSPRLGLVLDVRREADMAAMAERTLERFGRIDMLVASAGILRARGGRAAMLKDQTVAEWDEVIETNLRGTFLSNRAVLPAMVKQRGGQIINVSSTSGRQGLAYDSAYCASKFGVIGLTEALAEEVRQYNIRVQVILPDAIDTPIWQQNRPLPVARQRLPVERVAEFIVMMLTLPEDTVILSPALAPFWYRKRALAGTVGRADLTGGLSMAQREETV